MRSRNVHALNGFTLAVLLCGVVLTACFPKPRSGLSRESYREQARAFLEYCLNEGLKEDPQDKTLVEEPARWIANHPDGQKPGGEGWKMVSKSELQDGTGFTFWIRRKDNAFSVEVSK